MWHSDLFDKKKCERGFGLVETLVGVAVFLLVSVSAYSGFVKVLQGIQVLKVKNSALSLATEQIEIARNLPYVDVGIVDGLPNGKIPREKTETRSGITFNILSSVRDIDDPFDGQIGETPNDLSPADYKMYEVSVWCDECVYTDKIDFQTIIAPQNLETQGNNGALFVRVFNSNGEPISGANVSIYNEETEDLIDISETTNNSGLFQIVDAPPSNQSYQILVTKAGYSSDRTYTVGDVNNPEPILSDATVVSGDVTQVSFAIDKISTLVVNTKDLSCDSVSDVDFNITGSKMIGNGVYKYDEDFSTNGSGVRTISNLEWDNYNILISDENYQLVGLSDLLPINLNPDTEKSVDVIVANKEPNSLLVQVKDFDTGLPVSDAVVTITRNGDDETLITNRGFVNQVDWSLGGGQEQIGNLSMFYSTDGNISYDNPVGEIKLSGNEGYYVSDGELISSIFDLSTSTNFHSLIWSPAVQPLGVGANSVGFQIATNSELNATTTWDFIGPDGTGGSYYRNSGEILNDVHDNNNYIRYKVFLSTADNQYTPTISDVAVTYGSECIPPGQVLFTDLNSGEYTITVEKAVYQTFSQADFSVDEDWQMFEVNLNLND